MHLRRVRLQLLRWHWLRAAMYSRSRVPRRGAVALATLMLVRGGSVTGLRIFLGVVSRAQDATSCVPPLFAAPPRVFLCTLSYGTETRTTSPEVSCLCWVALHSAS